MNGFNHLPNKTDQNTYIFYANASDSISGSFQTWNVPEYATFLHFTVIGGGAGGGSGYYTGSTAVTSGGGGGGAPGGLVAVSIPAVLLPKTLYLQVGRGGKGAPGQTVNGNGITGGTGEISCVCLYPEINPGSTLIQSSNTSPGGGVGGTAIAGGTAGTAITIADATNLKWLGIVGNTVAQTAATAGGLSNTAATSITYAGLLTGGGGGGGARNTSLGGNGGGIIMNSITSSTTIAISGGLGNATTGGDSTAGSSGFFSWKPFISTGGSGGGGQGGTTITLPGKPGGKGAYGSGGGGGGAGRYINSGAGGDGGDGLIIISIS
jgi:hypothetical protein